MFVASHDWRYIDLSRGIAPSRRGDDVDEILNFDHFVLLILDLDLAWSYSYGMDWMYYLWLWVGGGFRLNEIPAFERGFNSYTFQISA